MNAKPQRRKEQKSDETESDQSSLRVSASLRSFTDLIAQQEAKIREGGGEVGHARQKKLGRLSARERISRLVDAGADFLELNLWAGFEMYPQAGNVAAAGVITGVGKVHDRSCMIIANDATVKAGAFFPATVKKVLRAQKIAFRCNLPIIYLVDSAGVYLPMQDEIFPDEDDFGRIFRNNAVLSAAGVPQIAAVMGNCVAGGAYLPVLSDKLLMTEGSSLFLAGPALVKAAIGQEVDLEDLGGAAMHAKISGTVDYLEKDDEACLKRLRELVDLLPKDSVSKRSGKSASELDPQSLYDLINHEYDTNDLLKAIVDRDSFIEYKKDYGQSLLCGHASIAGRKIGIVANQRHHAKTAKGELQIGGVIYHDSADKAARFVMDCNQTGVPIVFFQDVQGFMVGRDSEHEGIIRSGAKLVNAVSNSTVPKITIIVGGSFGAGNYALCGKAFDPAFIFAWPSAKYAVMGADQAAETLLALAAKQTADADLEALRREIKSNYERQTDIRYAAARGWVDAIIAPHTTRDVLTAVLDLATRPPPKGGFHGGVMQV